MKKAALILLSCALLFTACQPQPSPRAEQPARPHDLTITQSVPFAAQELEAPGTLEELAAYRPFPTEYDAHALARALEALGDIHIETPASGASRVYLGENDYFQGYLASGTVTRAELDSLAAAMDHPQRPKDLGELLGAYGLSFAAMGEYAGDTLRYGEADCGEYMAQLQDMGHGVLCLTAGPWEPYRETVLHLVFCKEGENYRFAALCAPVAVGKIEKHRLIATDDLLYFECACDTAWGTGAYGKYARLLPLQAGASNQLIYKQDAYDLPLNILTREDMRLSAARAAPNGGAHFTLEGSFAYAYEGNDAAQYGDAAEAAKGEFARIFQGMVAFHVFDDNDGKGFYTYAQDIGPSLSFKRADAWERAFTERVSLLLRGPNEALCLIAEAFLGEMNLTVEGYPYLGSAELFKRWSGRSAKAYVAAQNNGQRCYMESAGRMSAASGSLAAADIPSLLAALEDPSINIGDALAGAALALAPDFGLPNEREVPAGSASLHAEQHKEALRHENGDALALEIRVPKRWEGDRYTFIYLLFLRQGENYDFITAYKRGEYVEPRPILPAQILQAGQTYYLHGEGWNEWVPFSRGGDIVLFRPDGGAFLGNLAGASLEYTLEFANPFQSEGGALVCDVTIHYSHRPTRVNFDLPLRLFNEGEGFYSLDTNSPHFFADVLAVPYARELVAERLALLAQSADRNERILAQTYLQALEEGALPLA